MNLPNRTEQEERSFLEALTQNGDTEQYILAIQKSIQEKRPQLAGKIFALIEEPVEMDGDLRKAQRALAFLDSSKRRALQEFSRALG